MVSVDAFKRSLSERVSLNRQILRSPYWVLPVEDSGHEEYMPVGRGEKTSDSCGSHLSWWVCDNIEGHKGKSLNGVDVTGKIIVRHGHMWCKKSSCPVCFIRGWSISEARSIENRFIEGDRRGFGQVEHCMVSVALADRGLSEPVMRKKCRDALKDRGAIGGGMIFHGYRVGKEHEALVWSPHYHSLCYIEDDSFEKCRGCVHTKDDCKSCIGFKGREVRGYAKDGYLVKVLPRRKTVFGTAYYQLHHSTIRLGIKRFHVVTWFGNCATRKFKSAEVKAKISCAVCKEPMVKAMYMGKRRIVKDIGHVDYEAVFPFERLDENGELYFIPVRGSRVGSFG